MPIVDAHPHVMTPDRERYPLSPLGGNAADWVERGLPHDGYAAQLDAAGIRLAVLVQAAMAYGYDNRYVADSAALHPDRFVGVGTLDVAAPDAVQRLVYWVRERGLVGVRIFLIAPGLGAEPERVLLAAGGEPFWETILTLGVPVKLQLLPAMLRSAAELARRYPGVDFIIDHFAKVTLADGPPYAAAADLWALAALPRVNLLLSDAVLLEASRGRSTQRSFLEHTLAAFGADRMLWGSNFPASPGSVADLLAIAREAIAFLPERDRAAILGGTALRLYPALSAARRPA